MRHTKLKTIFALAAISSLLLTASSARANLVGPTIVSPANESDATIISTVSSTIADPGEIIIDLLRIDEPDSGPLVQPPLGSPFTVTYGTTGEATISWNLTGTGHELEGVYIFGGGSANLYGVTLDEELSGSGSITTPLNRGGQTPRISHILFLGANSSTSVPDASNCGALLSFAVAGLAFFRRNFLKR